MKIVTSVRRDVIHELEENYKDSQLRLMVRIQISYKNISPTYTSKECLANHFAI
jgi:hypothetical protein